MFHANQNLHLLELVQVEGLYLQFLVNTNRAGDPHLLMVLLIMEDHCHQDTAALKKDLNPLENLIQLKDILRVFIALIEDLHIKMVMDQENHQVLVIMLQEDQRVLVIILQEDLSLLSILALQDLQVLIFMSL